MEYNIYPTDEDSVEDIVMSNVCIMEALINVLESKGVLNRRELQKEIAILSKDDKKTKKQ
jgi:hypothetical protein